jgi:hypothetical protein
MTKHKYVGLDVHPALLSSSWRARQLSAALGCDTKSREWLLCLFF